MDFTQLAGMVLDVGMGGLGLALYFKLSGLVNTLANSLQLFDTRLSNLDTRVTTLEKPRMAPSAAAA